MRAQLNGDHFRMTAQHSTLCPYSAYSDCTSHTTTLVPGIVFQNSQCHGFRLSDFDLLTSSTLTSASLSPPSLAVIIFAVAPFPTTINVAVLLTSPTCTVKGKPLTLRFFFLIFELWTSSSPHQPVIMAPIHRDDDSRTEITVRLMHRIPVIGVSPPAVRPTAVRHLD